MAVTISPITKRVALIGIIVLVLLMFIGAALMLFITTRLQQKIASQQPNYSPSELYSKAVDQVNQGQYTVAEQYLEQALQKADDATYENQLAVVKYRLKKYDEAIALYQKLINEGKDPAFAWNGIGNVYRDWADTDPSQANARRQKAEDAYQKAIALNSGYVAAYSNLALLYLNTGRQQDALTILNQGIQATGSKELEQVKANISAH